MSIICKWYINYRKLNVGYENNSFIELFGIFNENYALLTVFSDHDGIVFLMVLEK